MKNHKGNITIILVVLLLLIGAAGAYITMDWIKQKDKVAELEKLREIKALDGILKDALTFEFAQVTTTFVLELNEKYDRPPGGVGVLKDLVHAFYSTDYTFTFGYDLQNWDWCSKTLDQQQGIVQVKAPDVAWTNAHTSINPDRGTTIDGIYYTDLESVVQQDVKKLMTKKIKEKASAYLADSKLKLNIERALSGFLQQTMNDAHDGNPISKVIISNTCN
jgi:hypothetical protein